jgi:hypothetical protein
MAILMMMIWILPLFPATPGLAPVYHPVDHMMPPAFPVLLIIPALAIDRLVKRLDAFGWTISRAPSSGNVPWPRRVIEWFGWRDWILAGAVATAFVFLFVAVQWPFSDFLLSNGADNWFFARDGHWPYFVRPGEWMNSFWDLKTDPLTPGGLMRAWLHGLLASRAGLWLGNFLLVIRR